MRDGLRRFRGAQQGGRALGLRDRDQACRRELRARRAAKIASFEAFGFVTPKYKHTTSGALKNAIDFLFREWNEKVSGLVSYASAGGTRAVEHLRLVMAELKVADVRQQVALSLIADFESYTIFKPHAHHEKGVNATIDEVVA
jgi:NAD(P)H-dependent FMN reductase